MQTFVESYQITPTGSRLLGSLTVEAGGGKMPGTVGYGDFVPSGEIKIIAGLEALAGLLVIAWSAAITVFCLERRWEKEDDGERG